MSDPLKEIRRISDPVTVHAYTHNDKRIVLLGDAHVPHLKGCKSCEPPQCLTYDTLLDALEVYHSNKAELDIFFEGFLIGDMKSVAQKRRAYDYEMKNAAALDAHGASLRIYNIRKRLYPAAFFRKHRRGANQRVHVTDVRILPNIIEAGFHIGPLLLGTPEQRTAYLRAFYARYHTLGAYEAAVREICFGDPVKSRVAKQFWKLPPKYQRLVRSVFATVFKSIKTRHPLFNGQHMGTNIFQTMCLMMDIYTLSRLLRYHEQQPAGSTIVVFAGALHTFVLAEAMRIWGEPETLFAREATIEELETMTTPRVCHHVTT